MRHISASAARKELAEVINQVAYGKERIVIGRRGRELAAVVPIKDLRLLERLADHLEDRLDAEEASRILADPTDALISWERVKRALAVRDPGEGKRPARSKAAPRRGPQRARARHRRTR